MLKKQEFINKFADPIWLVFVVVKNNNMNNI